MRKQFFTYLVFLLGLIAGWGNSVCAADELGAEIRYECLNAGDSYRIYVTRYYACDALPVPVPDPAIDIMSPTGGCQAPTPLGSWVAGAGIDVTPLCPGIGTDCNGSTSPLAVGALEYVFYQDYDFSGALPGCDDYRISLRTCCRSDSITSGSADGNLYVHTEGLDPFLCNHSPEFLFPALVYLDDNTVAQAGFGAHDPDGDSLAFSLVSCLDTFGVPTTYSPGFSGQQPLGPNWQTDIDPATGTLTFAPTPGGKVVAPVCVQVSEFRDGALLSTYVRDITVSVLTNIPDAPGSLPFMETPFRTDSVTGGTWVDSFTVEASIGRPLDLELHAYDSSGDLVQVTWTENIPLDLFYQVGDPTVTDTIIDLDPKVGVSWIPTRKGRNLVGIQLSKMDTLWCGFKRLRDYTVVIDVRDTCLWAGFAQDTVYICAGDTVSLSPTVHGSAQGPLQYTWSTGATSSSLDISTPGSYTVDVRDKDSVCMSEQVPVEVLYAPYCVWPGDTDNDGEANNYDVLSIGLGYGYTGPTRAGGLTWTGQQATGWVDTLPGGLNAVHADANGDGIADVNDTLGIIQNYGLSHNKGDGLEGAAGSPPLFFQSPTSQAMTGDTLQIPIFLGTSSQPADSIYGIAFSIQYDNTIVDTNTAHIVVDSSWLGDPRAPVSDLFSAQKDFYFAGQIDIGISRNDHTERNNHGQIARLDIIMIEDLTAKRALVDTLRLDFSGVRIITASGKVLDFSSSSLEIPVVDPSANSVDPELLANGIQVYPNPAVSRVIVEVASEIGPMDLRVYRIDGQLMVRSDEIRDRIIVNTQHWVPGLYFFKMKTDKGVLTKKIQVINK